MYSSHLCLNLWSLVLSSGFPIKILCTLLFPHVCHVPSPSHPQFDHPNVWRATQILKLLSVQFSPVCCNTSPLRPKYLPQTPLCNTLSPCSPLNVLHPCNRTVVAVLTFTTNSLHLLRIKNTAACFGWPPLWSSGQSFWLQIQRSRVRFPALPDFSE